MSSSAAQTAQTVTLPPIPELFNPDFLDVLLPPQHSEPRDPAPSNKMMDALRSVAHQKRTENDAPAFSSTLSHTLDAYFGIRQGVTGRKVDRYLANAWAVDPALTLRIIWHCRSIHDGKGEKELFYRFVFLLGVRPLCAHSCLCSAFGWLYENHPRTAIYNLQYLVSPLCLSSSNNKSGRKHYSPHGYWKDLLNILALATLDELTLPSFSVPSNFLHNNGRLAYQPSFKSIEDQKAWARVQRSERFANAHTRVVRKLGENRYRALYIAVSRLFTDQLVKDSKTLDKLDQIAKEPGKAKKRKGLEFALSLAAKWAPTPGGAHDRVTNIASAICILLNDDQLSWCPPVSASQSQVPVEAATLHRLRGLYQTLILTRARRALCVPEPFMSSNSWSSVPYDRVSSLCMHANKANFFTHDPERFTKFLADVESGRRKGLSGATLMPHVLVMEAVRLEQLLARHAYNRELIQIELRTVDAQWASLVSRIREAGTLDNCIAVCDVSGSMGLVSYCPSTKSKFKDVHPIWPAISLSLLIARLAKPPFHNAFIPFSASPSLVTLDSEDAHVGLGQTVTRMAGEDWGMNTDFEAVFLKLILPLAVANNVPQEDMIKRVFVFTDMQFDISQTHRAEGWKTNHDMIEHAYKEAGYDMPEIVYWDLSDASVHKGITAPVTGDREGVAMLSGYSAALLKVFMGVGDEEEGWEIVDDNEKKKWVMTPEEMMLKAVGRRSFEPLRVVD